MRAKRDRTADRRDTKRRKSPGTRNGIPKLGLWEVGIGAVWR